MDDTNVDQEATTRNPEISLRRLYAPWMIGVLIIFGVCEFFLGAWGDEASRYAVWGLFAALAFGVSRFFRVRGKWLWRDFFVVLIIVVILAALLLPAMQQARESARRAACHNNLKQLGLALLNYENDYHRFPPAFVADEKGKPMHSWRTLILPFMEEGSLYEAYDFEKPWDSPENRNLVERAPYVLRCPSCPCLPDHPGLRTNYVAVLGEDTFWPADGSSRSRDELKVDPSQVVMLIEIYDSDILWNEPRDVQLDDLLSGKLSWRETAPHCSRPSAFDEPLMGRNVVFADGSVYFIPDGTTTDQLRRLFSITEPFDVQKEIIDFSRRPIVFRYVVFYVWLATLFVQFVYIFFPVRRRKS